MCVCVRERERETHWVLNGGDGDVATFLSFVGAI